MGNFDDVGFVLNGASIKRVGETVFIALPRELWRKAMDGKCSCPVCRERKTDVAYWDTLAVPVVPNPSRDYAFTVHMPELHSANGAL